jgi:hypothetical protein
MVVEIQERGPGLVADIDLVVEDILVEDMHLVVEDMHPVVEDMHLVGDIEQQQGLSKKQVQRQSTS